MSKFSGISPEEARNTAEKLRPGKPLAGALRTFGGLFLHWEDGTEMTIPKGES